MQIKCKHCGKIQPGDFCKVFARASHIAWIRYHRRYGFGEAFILAPLNKKMNIIRAMIAESELKDKEGEEWKND